MKKGKHTKGSLWVALRSRRKFKYRRKISLNFKNMKFFFFNNNTTQNTYAVGKNNKNYKGKEGVRCYMTITLNGCKKYEN